MQIYTDKYFENPAEIIEIFDPEKVKEGIDRVEKLRDSGFFLLGYMRYNLNKINQKGAPLVYFEAYKNYTKLSDITDSYTAESHRSEPAGTYLIPQITKDEYIRRIKYIKEQILNGITYEVNYTYPSVLKSNITGIELYRYLLPRQKTPYNAFINNSHETIMSFSPELFFRIEGSKITTRPMKGTIRRGNNPDEDQTNREFLVNDSKNRAENLMIVDLIRNDLGIIARDGSVKADRLFQIEEHPTVFQMTSEISAELRDDISLYDVIRALYPCGSITGAPKLSTMRVIEETEPYDREVYCGAIAFIHRDRTEFSVPIRILQKHSDEHDFKYFAGGAITFDSTAEDEWTETISKARFLESDFSLIETGSGDRELHLARLKKSADALNFKWNSELDSFEFPENIVSRIELFKDGHYQVTTRMIPAPADRPKVRIKGKVDSANPFLYHKTTVRSPYPHDFFEEIRTNEKNEITEGTFTNVAVRIGDHLYTPPLSCGLLNGVMRQKLLQQGLLKEKILYPEDLANADCVYCMNSIRGIFEVELCF